VRPFDPCLPEPAVLDLYRARAWRRGERLHDALRGLRRSRNRFDRMGERRLAVECLLEESLILRMLEDPQALAAARRGLAQSRGLSEPRRSTLIGRALAQLGHVYADWHEWADAATCLHAALASCPLDPERLATIHGSLARACLGVGDLARATVHNQTALAAGARDELVLAEAESALAATLAAARSEARAVALLESSLARRKRAGSCRGCARILLELAALELGRDRGAAARACASGAAKLASELGERATLATASTLLGRVAVHVGGSNAEVDRSYGGALKLLLALGAHRRVAEVSLEYGRVLEARGDEFRALKQYRRAAVLTA
jgi:tetratricopeptide (TPR) repeat protein